MKSDDLDENITWECPNKSDMERKESFSRDVRMTFLHIVYRRICWKPNTVRLNQEFGRGTRVPFGATETRKYKV
jgi:hypothetical protein